MCWSFPRLASVIPEMCLYAADDVSTGDCICVGRGSPSVVGSRLPPFRAKRLDDRVGRSDLEGLLDASSIVGSHALTSTECVGCACVASLTTA